MNNFINNLSIVDLQSYLKSIEPQNLIFNAPLGNIFEYYYSIEESVEILDELLHFQFYNEKKQVEEFSKNLYKIIRRVSKVTYLGVLKKRYFYTYMGVKQLFL